MVIHDVIEALKDEAGGGARIVMSPNKDAAGYVTRQGGRQVMVKVTVDEDRLFLERQEKWGGDGFERVVSASVCAPLTRNLIKARLFDIWAAACLAAGQHSPQDKRSGHLVVSNHETRVVKRFPLYRSATNGTAVLRLEDSTEARRILAMRKEEGQ